ncbi:MAG: N-acetylmuramoyl-L-alanine amidase [Candidatus Polarisedimenticolia bacterium]
MIRSFAPRFVSRFVSRFGLRFAAAALSAACAACAGTAPSPAPAAVPAAATPATRGGAATNPATAPATNPATNPETAPATLGGAATNPAASSPLVAIDVGHSPLDGGARSARGAQEFSFNRRFARELADALRRDGVVRPLVIQADRGGLMLVERMRLATAAGAAGLLSIHHDSAQLRYFEPCRVDGRETHCCPRFRGHSVFVSRRGPAAEASLAFARRVAEELRRAGFVPTLHHAEPVPGEGRTLLDPGLGLYAFDELKLLRGATIPAALLECGVLVNPDEELELSDPARRARFAAAVAKAIEETFGARAPGVTEGTK